MAETDRKYPRGKLNADDEGEVSMRLGVDGDCVVLAFAKEVGWIAMPAEMAEQLADRLRSFAATARRNRQ